MEGVDETPGVLELLLDLTGAHRDLDASAADLALDHRRGHDATLHDDGEARLDMLARETTETLAAVGGQLDRDRRPVERIVVTRHADDRIRHVGAGDDGRARQE